MKRLWTGRIMSGLAVLFLLFDSTTKLLRVEAAVISSTAKPWRAAQLLKLSRPWA